MSLLYLRQKLTNDVSVHTNVMVNGFQHTERVKIVPTGEVENQFTMRSKGSYMAHRGQRGANNIESENQSVKYVAQLKISMFIILFLSCLVERTMNGI